MTEAELRQVQQQQELFQTHLMNMQRHLAEQSQEQQPQGEEDTRAAAGVSSSHLPRRSARPYPELNYDDDQARIAQLIESDPYFAAAMEDFAHSHGLLDDDRSMH
jgi:hypothetical protein